MPARLARQNDLRAGQLPELNLQDFFPAVERSILIDRTPSPLVLESSRSLQDLAARLHRCVDSLVLVAESSAETRSELFQAAYLLRGLNRAGIEAVLADVARHLADPALADAAFLTRAAGTQAPAREESAGISEGRSGQPSAAASAAAEPKPDRWFQRIFFARKAQEGPAPRGGAARESSPGAAPASSRPAGAPESQAGFPPRPVPAAAEPSAPAGVSPQPARIPPIHLPPRPAQSTVVRSPLTTARWNSGRRTRLETQSAPERSSASPVTPVEETLLNPGRGAAESGIRRAAVVAGVPVALSAAPASAWSPRAAGSAPEPPVRHLQHPEDGAPMSRPWDLLSRFDTGGRPAAPRGGTGSRDSGR